MAPTTKAARQAKIREVIAQTAVRSQAELAAQLADAGLHVTQGTLSRDLVEIGAARVRSAAGALIYAVPSDGPERELQAGADVTPSTDRLASLCRDLLLSAEASANLVILRTPPGGAQFLASAVDHTVSPGILGTIAGDDSIMVVTTAPDGGQSVAQWFNDMAEGRAV